MKQAYLKKADYFTMAAVIVVLLVSCLLLAPKKMFWNDEFYSWYLLSDASFLHMWQAFGDKINNSPPLYFLLGWIWAQVFSASEVSLRLFSSLGLCVALVLVWVTLRRYYAFLPVAVAIIAVFSTSELLIQQNTEARMYGLFLATAAWVFWVYDQLCRQAMPSSRLLLWNLLAHAAFVNTHLHGLFFSGAILAGILVRDMFASAFRPKVYVSIALSWLTLLLYLPAFWVQIDAGQPRSWMPEPLMEDLTGLYSTSNTYVNMFAVAVVVLIAMLPFAFPTRLPARAEKNTESITPNFGLIIFALAVLLTPVGVWVISRISRPIFFDRYLIPATIGFIILLTQLCALLFAQIRQKEFQPLQRQRLIGLLPHYLLRFFLLLSCLVMLSYPLRLSVTAKENKVIFGENFLPEGYENLPVVCQVAGIFHAYMAYADHRDQYFFVLDHDSAMESASGQYGFQEYKHLDALKRNYGDYFRGQIIESEDFLKKFDRFLVLDYADYDKACPPHVLSGLKAADTFFDIHCPQWPEKRILYNPDYKTEVLVQNQWMTYILVERVE